MIAAGTQAIENREMPIPEGTLLFDENFDSLNVSIWERTIKMPLSPVSYMEEL